MLPLIESGIILLLVVVPALIGVSVRKKDAADDSLSVDAMLPVRGLMALAVLLQHLSGWYEGTTFLSLFQRVGYLMVAMFLFLSGYGVYYGFAHKKNYLHGFLIKRLPSVIIPYWIADAACFVLFLAIGKNPSPVQLATSLVGVDLLFGPAYYITLMVVLYVLFWFCFRVFRTDAARFASFFILLAVCMTLCIVFVKDDLYIRSTAAFPVGMLWGRYKDRINAKLSRFSVWLACFLSLGVVTVGGIGLSLIGRHFGNALLASACDYAGKIISSAAFVAMMAVLFDRVRLGSPVMRFIGSISLEVYLLHPMLLEAFGKIGFIRQHSLVFFVCVTGTAVLLGWGFHRLNNLILKVFKKRSA